MDREAANWLAVIERENEVPLFVRKSSNDIQLGKVASEERTRFSFFRSLPASKRWLTTQLASNDNSNVKWIEKNEQTTNQETEAQSVTTEAR